MQNPFWQLRDCKKERKRKGRDFTEERRNDFKGDKGGKENWEQRR